MEKPDLADILRRAVPLNADVAREVGVTHRSLSLLKHGGRKGSRATRRRIAVWLRKRAAEMAADADALDASLG